LGHASLEVTLNHWAARKWVIAGLGLMDAAPNWGSARLSLGHGGAELLLLAVVELI